MDFGFLFGQRRQKTIEASVHFAKHTLPAALKPAHILWHQMIGFLFLMIAAGAGTFTFRAVRNFKGDGESWARLVLSLIFTLIMLGYGASSFWKARKLSR